MLLLFPKRPRRHGRASRVSTRAGARAASAVIIEAVVPAWRATAVANTADHHSAGILSRCHHLLTAEALAPMSEAMASFEDQRSITARNEVGSNIESCLGQIVLECKDNSSHDCELPTIDTCDMAKPKVATEFIEGFQARTAQARDATGRSQTKMANLLSTDQGTYKNWESRDGSVMPHEYIVLFCELCSVSIHWLFTNEGEGPKRADTPSATEKRTGKPAKGKAAA